MWTGPSALLLALGADTLTSTSGPLLSSGSRRRWLVCAEVVDAETFT